jgi:asparagine synthase (glutamine-hydrolysing)
MCGLTAIIAPSPAPLAGLVRSATRLVAHRGPDDEGYVLFSAGLEAILVAGGDDTPDACYRYDAPYAPRTVLDLAAATPALVAIGHRRLSIIDVSAAGHQPLCSADGRYWIIYNGEIYNYIELRRELGALGYAFRTQTDTEVMLAAYDRWGSDCLHRFNGMFSFVILDRTARRLFAARDRFGVKPLYYWISPEGLITFASEIKQFAVLPGWKPRVNGQRTYDFINWALLDHTDETLFDGVFQLRGGEALVLELGGNSFPAAKSRNRLPVYRWYELQPRVFDGSLASAGEEFRRLLTDSVRLRLRADVPVGTCLSGGLDSSSIVCVMNGLLRDHDAHAHAQQNTFSACSTVRRFDERDYIDEVIRHTGITAHYVYPRIDELFPAVDRITWHQDEPFGSTSIYAQWHVFGLAAASGVKVILDGQGADEQLAGYHNYFAPRFGSLFRGLRWVRLARELRKTAHLHGQSVQWGARYALNNILPEWLRQPLRRLIKQSFANPVWLDMDRLGAEPRDPYLASGSARSHSVRVMSLTQLTAASLPMLLHWEDRDSMAHSIEARVPFLDYRLVEFVLGLPDEYKIADGMTKRVLREGMRGVLPERVRTRIDKMGFVTPEETWLREDSPDRFRTALAESVELSGGIISPRVLELLERVISGREPFSFLIWRCISFGRWLKVFHTRA